MDEEMHIPKPIVKRHRNSDKLNSMAMIDILSNMAENRLKLPIIGPCVLYLLTGDHNDKNYSCTDVFCGISDVARKNQTDKCRKCIANWLNKEEK